MKKIHSLPIDSCTKSNNVLHFININMTSISGVTCLGLCCVTYFLFQNQYKLARTVPLYKKNKRGKKAALASQIIQFLLVVNNQFLLLVNYQSDQHIDHNPIC